jgi:hypothetical protein
MNGKRTAQDVQSQTDVERGFYHVIFVLGDTENLYCIASHINDYILFQLDNYFTQSF